MANIKGNDMAKSQKKFTVEEFTKAIQAKGDLPRMQRNLETMKKEEGELLHKLGLLQEKIHAKETEIEEAEALIDRFGGIDEVLGEYLKSVQSNERPESLPQTRQRLSSSMKKEELQKFFKSLAGRKTVKLADVKRHFEDNVTGKKIGNVSLYFNNVIPDEMYVEGTHTRNREVHVKQTF